MPVLEGRHDGRQIIVAVLVGGPSYLGSPHLLEGSGLIDTGASTSLITRRFAAELGLPPRGKHPPVTARGIDLVDRHEFRLGFVLPQADGPPVPYMIDRDLIGSEFVDHANFDVIVGMDVLRSGGLILRPDYSFPFDF